MYKRHRFPPEIIQYAVWLYHRFNLSHRDIEDLMSQRGIEVSYEAIRLWCNKFGAKYAQRLRRKPKAMAILSSLMRCSLRSRGSSTICGVLWIRMVRLLMYSCRNDEMERLQSASLGGYCVKTTANHVRLSLINWRATTWLIENWSRRRFTTQLNMPTIELSCHTSRREWESGACVNSNQCIRRSDFWVHMQLSITYLTWADIWYQQKIIGISGCVPLRLGKRQWRCREGLTRIFVDLES